MKSVAFLLFQIILLSACGQTVQPDPNVDAQPEVEAVPRFTNSGTTIATRVNPPIGFERTKETEHSFGNYLRNLPLKASGSKVMYYNGIEKGNQSAYCAVIDLPIGKKDLHQCADAVMRLRAEYLFQQKRFDEIHFNFTNGFNATYAKWRQGQRINVSGNSVSWRSGGAADTSYESFWKYLEQVFTYAGTLSLSKELKSVSIAEMQIGDVFIQGGSPGHAVIVVDMAEDELSGKKVFLLAQSYMPAQEIQVLNNPSDSELSPWYDLDFGSTLITPEWTFRSTDLKRF